MLSLFRSGETSTTAPTENSSVGDFFGGAVSAVNPFETQLYDAVVKAIIRPPRAVYSVEMLGSRSITRHGLTFIRRDFELRNERGKKLQCSWWAPSDRRAVLPCVVYLHGNAGCRVDALSVANQVLALHISLFAFDFSGSGKSDGDTSRSVGGSETT